MTEVSSLIYSYESDEDFLKEFGDNEVTVPDTITDRGFDIPNGLLDQNIFGPVRDYTCRCGELTGALYEGEYCPKCGVKITTKNLRKKNFGYFKLNFWIPNPVFFDQVLAKLFKLSSDQRDCLYTPTKFYLVYNPNGYLKMKDGTRVSVSITGYQVVDESPMEPVFLGYGMEMIRSFVDLIDLTWEPSHWFATRPNLLDELSRNPITNIIRVIPVAYRDINFIDDEATVDSMNLLYKDIMAIAIRMKAYRDMEIEGYEVDYHTNAKYWYEVRRLADEVRTLYTGSGVLKTQNNKPIRTYQSILNSKSGLIRGGLLSKRSFFSARTVNTSSQPHEIDISHDEIKVPYFMAKNLLRIHIVARLVNMGRSFRSAMDMIDNDNEEVEKYLHELDNKFYVYTTRAPCLYKFSLMAFRLRVNFNKSDKTLKIHSVQNAMFNLDYDGDTMALFLPITVQAQDEARVKATPSCNPFFDKDGSPIYQCSLEFIYGFYYMTNTVYGTQVDSYDDAKYYCDYVVDNDGRKITLGSKLMADIINKWLLRDPKNRPDTYKNYFNIEKLQDKKSIKTLISELLYNETIEISLNIINDLMDLSTKAFTESGLSIKFSDFTEVDKSELLADTNIIEYSNDEDRIIRQLEAESKPDNAFISMRKSGAKGNYTQLKQVMVSKGILVDEKGDYLKPIVHSLYDGLTFEEFITTISSARRGMICKSLSTAKTGYLYYKVAKSMRDLEVTEDDCETKDGFEVKISECQGRYLAEDINKDFPAGTLMTRGRFVALMEQYKGDMSSLKVKVRSPLYCKAKKGICAHCYGMSVSKNTRVSVGARVGIISASSLSEVITQAMLKNFHTAGATETKMIDVHNGGAHVDKLDVVDLGKFQKISFNNKSYVVAKDNLNLIKTEDINSDDLIFQFGIGNDDVTKQYERLESILESRYSDCALIANQDGIFEFDQVVDGVDYSETKIEGNEYPFAIPKKVQYISVRINGPLGITKFKVPFSNVLLVPFGTEVHKGQILTTGIIDYRAYSELVDRDQLVSTMVDDLDYIYTSQGAKIKKIHFEIYVKHLLQVSGDDYEIKSILASGKDRSFIQWTSLGFIKNSYLELFDRLNGTSAELTNAERIARGIY